VAHFPSQPEPKRPAEGYRRISAKLKGSDATPPVTPDIRPPHLEVHMSPAFWAVLVIVVWLMRIRMSRYLATLLYFLARGLQYLSLHGLISLRRALLRRQFRRVVREGWPSHP
jgi:hypothetical protein